ncbi:mCG142754 [Mus musculus]|nr:mCG142754 [Mus musculus]
MVGREIFICSPLSPRFDEQLPVFPRGLFHRIQ